MSTTYAHRYGDFAEVRMSPEEIAAIQDVPLGSVATMEFPEPDAEVQAAGAAADDEVEDAIARGEDPNAEEFPEGEDEDEIEGLSDEELDALTS